MINIQNVHKSFKEGSWPFLKQKPVLKGISLIIQPGEIVGIIGKNGAGKTTLFKLLAGLEHATQGTIEVNQLDVVKHTSEIRNLIGFLPEKPAFSRIKTGYESLVEYGALFGLIGHEFKEKLNYLTKIFDAKDLLTMNGKAYSRGQAVKLALIRTFLNDAQYLVLDEPTVGLDFKTAHNVRKIILQAKKEGKGVLLATHIIHDIETLCTRVVGLKNGVLLDQNKTLSWIHEEKMEQENIMNELKENESHE
jgi:ABC-type multidrug transport system ATPase subunit